MLLSVILPAFNGEKYLGRTLERIEQAFRENQHPDLSWEIIVCDNNSTDGTAEVAAERGAKVVFEPHNQIARARNTGAALARGEWLLFVDADSHPSPGLIAEMLGWFRNRLTKKRVR
ncbi:glycosyltransferase family 2 protein [Chloroflexi bacterium TSY]|nr:glycosyltransferase family 2 protein [Chloroflexi bacterium TSY]